MYDEYGLWISKPVGHSVCTQAGDFLHYHTLKVKDKLKDVKYVSTYIECKFCTFVTMKNLRKAANWAKKIVPCKNGDV